MSAIKYAGVNYATVLTPEELLIYYGNEVKLRASGKLILTVWRYKTSGLLRVTLKPKVSS